jgi:hypothetical protein
MLACDRTGLQLRQIRTDTRDLIGSFRQGVVLTSHILEVRAGVVDPAANSRNAACSR